MAFINFALLDSEISDLQQTFNGARPFRYLVIDNFLSPETAEEMCHSFPDTSVGIWNRTTYINQRNKLQSSEVSFNPLFKQVFTELNSERMLNFLHTLTGVSGLTGDDKFFGAGLHQSMNGAFLDVHVDFNVHPDSQLYRRLNLLVFLNKDWKSEYGGELEFWDMENRRCVEKIVPAFNRCVIFETTEKSFHGHPSPLQVPEGLTRKSLATYYYTEQIPEGVTNVPAHNTLFKNTTGVKGKLNNLLAGLVALKERLMNKL